jgi:hypothetical protein
MEKITRGNFSSTNVSTGDDTQTHRDRGARVADTNLFAGSLWTVLGLLSVNSENNILVNRGTHPCVAAVLVGVTGV